MYHIYGPAKLPLRGTYLAAVIVRGVGDGRGEYPLLDYFSFHWNLYGFVTEHNIVLVRVGFRVVVGTLTSGEPLKGSHCLDVSGRVNNSYAVESRAIPVHSFGSYEHAATIGW